MICDKCGKHNADDALFCAECGRALKNKPINLNLKEINIPAASRQPRIVKVSAAKKAENEEEQGLPIEKSAEETVPNSAEYSLDYDDSEEVEETESEVIDDDEELEEADETEEYDEDDEPDESEDDEEEEDSTDFIKFGTDEDEEKAEKSEPEAEEKGEFKIDADVEKIFRPMRKRDWLLVFVLTAIPGVNVIALLIWALGIKVNRSKKTYAQMMLILAVIAVALVIIACVILYFLLGPDFLNQLRQLV